MMIRLSSMKIVLLIGTIYSRVSLEQIKTAFDEVFQDREGDGLEYTIINPLFGYMFRANGCVENMRFYSPELEIKYAKGVRNYKSDDSKDSLTKLVIHLFPSHTGTFNNLIGKNANFTYKYFKSHKPYDNENRDNNREANIKMLGDTFVELLKNGTKKNFPKPSKSQKTPYTEFRYYVTIPSSSSHLKDDEIYIKLLTLYAYALEESESENELKIYLKAISDGLDNIPTEKYPALCLNNKQKELFKRLYTNPFKFPYSTINQPASNSSIPIYDRKEDKPVAGQNFSDCADIAILHLCNCLFYDELTGECSLDQIKLKESVRLREFYEKYHYKPFQVTEKMRNDWSRVVQGLDDNKAFNCQDSYKPYMIHYVNQKYSNEIKSGILNTMSVLASICGVDDDEYERIMTEEPISEDSVADKLIELFEKIRNKKVKVTIEGSDIKEVAHDNVSDFKGDFYLTLDLYHSKTSITMKLCISKGHTTCFFEDMKSKKKEADFSRLKNLKSDSNNFMLPSLINRYIQLLNNNDVKTENFDYIFEVLYNQGVIRTNEQKRDQCIHLCEFIDKNNTFDHRITKKVIENIVKSANLSDPATSIIFRPFFIYIDDIFEQMTSYEVFETWSLVFSKDLRIRSQSIKNTWNKVVKKSSKKIRGMGLSHQYTDSIVDVATILSVTKDTLEGLKLVNFNLDPEKYAQIIQEFLADNKALKALAILENNLSSTNIHGILKSLKKLKSLRTLDISFNKLSDDDAKLLANALKNNNSVTTLNIAGVFSETSGGECIANILASNKTLTALDISGNNIGNEGFQMIASALKNNKTLTTLRITYSKLDAENIKYIADALEGNRTLTTLDISNSTSIGPDGVKLIIDAIMISNTLNSLNISQTCSDGNKNEFARHIAQILQSNAPLTSLNISYNKLKAEDAKWISEALKCNSTLTELDISKNNLGYRGAKYIASIFAEDEVLGQFGTSSSGGPANNTLTTLNILSNNIKNKGAKCLADIIEKSESLVCLDISYNSFENDGIDCIANALAKNKFLKVFNIQSLFGSTSDTKKILYALKENRSLVELSLNYFGTQNEMSECIADALKENQILKTLDIKLSDETSIEDRTSLCNAIEEKTTLEKLIFRTNTGSYILLSDRMPIGSSTGHNTDSKLSEFQRIEIYLEAGNSRFK